MLTTARHTATHRLQHDQHSSTNSLWWAKNGHAESVDDGARAKSFCPVTFSARSVEVGKKAISRKVAAKLVEYVMELFAHGKMHRATASEDVVISLSTGKLFALGVRSTRGKPLTIVELCRLLGTSVVKHHHRRTANEPRSAGRCTEVRLCRSDFVNRAFVDLADFAFDLSSVKGLPLGDIRRIETVHFIKKFGDAPFPFPSAPKEGREEGRRYGEFVVLDRASKRIVLDHIRLTRNVTLRNFDITAAWWGFLYKLGVKAGVDPKRLVTLRHYASCPGSLRNELVSAVRNRTPFKMTLDEAKAYIQVTLFAGKRPASNPRGTRWKLVADVVLGDVDEIPRVLDVCESVLSDLKRDLALVNSSLNSKELELELEKMERVAVEAYVGSATTVNWEHDGAVFLDDDVSVEVRTSRMNDALNERYGFSDDLELSVKEGL